MITELSTRLSIGPVDVRQQDFDALVQTISPTMSAAQAIESTGKARNTLGHDLAWPTSLDEAKYDALFRTVACACLHAISTLYR